MRCYILFMLLSIQCISARTHAQSDETQIRMARAESNAAIAKHNPAGIIQHILPDYIIVTGRGKQVAGRDSVAAFWKQTAAAIIQPCGAR